MPFKKENWKQIIDHKYKTQEPNIFACPLVGLYLPSGKRLYRQLSLQKWGTKRRLVMGRRYIKFWEDHWFRSCSLAIQY
jgi:hypothetical protein